MKITVGSFAIWSTIVTIPSATTVQSRPTPEKGDTRAPIEGRQSVSGAFGLPINNIILGFLFTSTMFSLAGRMQGIASDWFDNTGPSGVSVIKEVQEPHDEYDYDDYEEGSEIEEEDDGVTDDETLEEPPHSKDSQLVTHNMSGMNVSDDNAELAENDSIADHPKVVTREKSTGNESEKIVDHASKGSPKESERNADMGNQSSSKSLP